jgi:cytochrome c nitrite reductase small subunit
MALRGGMPFGLRPIVLVLLAAGASLGAAAGLGGYTFVYAKGGSYLGSDSAACANCHIMNAQYAGWLKGSHRSVAQCNDCHAPHDVLGKYTTKAVNGFNHSWAFTSGSFPEPIRINARNLAITEGACRHCHAELVSSIDSHSGARQGLSCTGCHRDVGHLH